MEFNNEKHIEKLLAKYFEATTTVAEEKELQAYFNGDDVAPHLQEYTLMFQYFAVAKEERYTGEVPVTRSTPSNMLSYKKWISVAAVAVLSFGIYFTVNNQQTNSGSEMTIAEQQEAEKAYQQTKEAFKLLAMNLEKGKEQMSYLKEFEETKEKVFNK
ncbi:hypothetical protein SAMN05216480_10765 [Pustulibacterium marinum]|uniref:Uncharacterized protein n=1 Tax=Pustulibacterium marinum TaxID=1224947 RepID=A0A1I7H4Z8_9FLAO|nr:hypothetical protein [Pustulibacterium marinum]SFU55763.1 hypothetical protein SAMN05216480_10765 [Pustulibacterium marinum]